MKLRNITALMTLLTLTATTSVQALGLQIYDMPHFINNLYDGQLSLIGLHQEESSKSLTYNPISKEFILDVYTEGNGVVGGVYAPTTDIDVMPPTLLNPLHVELRKSLTEQDTVDFSTGLAYLGEGTLWEGTISVGDTAQVVILNRFSDNYQLGAFTNGISQVSTAGRMLIPYLAEKFQNADGVTQDYRDGGGTLPQAPTDFPFIFEVFLDLPASATIQPVPEPATWMFIGMFLFCLALGKHKLMPQA